MCVLGDAVGEAIGHGVMVMATPSCACPGRNLSAHHRDRADLTCGCSSLSPQTAQEGETPESQLTGPLCRSQHWGSAPLDGPYTPHKKTCLSVRQQRLWQEMVGQAGECGPRRPTQWVCSHRFLGYRSLNGLLARGHSGPLFKSPFAA